MWRQGEDRIYTPPTHQPTNGRHPIRGGQLAWGTQKEKKKKKKKKTKTRQKKKKCPGFADRA